jgi:F-type H+-transporting ATPase subunit b
MLIDWFTVAAQALNFIILVFLLKHFLYKPILQAIDAREQKIAKELSDADAKKTEAKKERDEFQSKNEEFDKERSNLLKQATAEAKAEKQTLLDTAREEAADLRSKQQERLASDARTLGGSIASRTRQEVFGIVRKALSDLAGLSLEESMVHSFIEKITGLEKDKKEQLASALQASSGPVTVRTSFALSPEQKSKSEAAIKAALGPGLKAEFAIDSKLISGIELSAKGQKVGWNIADYLDSMELSAENILKDKIATTTKIKQEAEEPLTSVEAAKHGS